MAHTSHIEGGNMRNGLALLALAALITTAAAQQTTTAPDNNQPHLNSAPAQTAPSLPAGTSVKMKLETAISTAVTKVGDNFSGRTTEDVTSGGKIIIPVGSAIQGRVTRVVEERRYKGRPSLELRPEVITTPNGDRFNITAVVISTDKASDTKVNNEGRIVGPGIDRRDKVEMAAGTAAGAALGGGFAHSAKGAVVGAVIGGGSAVVFWLTKRKSANLEPGTEIVMELSRPMAISAAAAD
jgi:hypothetical protein